MISFDCPPAFGFQTANCNAINNFYKRFSTLYLPFFPKYLLCLSCCVTEKYSAKTAMKISNFITVMGYFPLIGTLVGISRILESSCASKENFPNKWNHFARGCVESLSLGFLLVIPDLIVTAVREYQASRGQV